MAALAPEWGGLCLFRRVGEEIVIQHAGEEAIVVVVAVGGGRVQLRIVAPDAWGIQRGEVLENGGDGKR